MGRLSIGQKLGAGFTVVICLTLLQAYASITAIENLGSMLDGTVKKSSRTSELVSDIQSGVSEMKSYAKWTQFAYALNGMLDHKTTGACASCHPLPDADKASREFAAFAAAVHPKIQELEATGLSPEEKQSLDRVNESTTEWVAVFRDFLAKASARQFEAGHSIITDRMEPIRERIEKATKELEALEVRTLVRSEAESAAAVKHRIVLLLEVQAAMLLPLIFLAWRFIRRLTARLRALSRAAHHLAAGDVASALSVLPSP